METTNYGARIRQAEMADDYALAFALASALCALEEALYGADPEVFGVTREEDEEWLLAQCERHEDMYGYGMPAVRAGVVR